MSERAMGDRIAWTVRPDPAGPGAAAVQQAALRWQVVLWSGEVTAEERVAFQRWLDADPLHQTAWRRVQRVDGQLHAVPAAISLPVLRSAVSARNHRRTVLRGIVLLAGGGALAWMASETPRWQIATAGYRTGRGERRELMLPDGSQVTLNTGSAVDLRFDERQRRLVLRRGEIFIATAPDDGLPGRPFVVETAEGVVRPLGTRFAVRRLDEVAPPRVLVQVVEGEVELMPLDGSTPVRLPAGRQASFTRSGVAAMKSADPAATAWLHGLLVAERMRLGDFIAELSRYRTGVLRCDPAVADLVISGVYPVANTDRVLQSLAQALPVRIRSATRYWVTVQP